MSRRAVLAAVLAALAAGGCGASVPNAAPTPAELAADLAGSPPQLASLHAQGNALITGASPARFTRLLSSLHGYPVIVNKWASWCYPCTTEFPAFQRVAAQYGKRIAFLGLNSGDQSGSARAFLARHPVSYPSYEDPHEQIAQAVDLAQYYPMTIFYDASGNVAFIHQGPYQSAAALSTDIHRYLHA